MELRHLRCAVAVADALHFGRAARSLGIAQPPLSQQIRALEDELGVRLFERSSRRVALTSAGEAFVAEARGVLAGADRATRAARMAGRGDTGRLVVGLVGSAAHAVLPGLMRAFRARHPDVEVTLREMPTAAQAAALLAGDLDAGLLRPPLAGEASHRLDVHAFGDEPLVAVVPAGHRLAARPRIPVRELAREPFVMFPRAAGPGLYDQIAALCRRGGFVLSPAQEAVQMQTIVGMVATGLWISIVPSSVARTARPDVAFVPVAPHAVTAGPALAWRRDDPSPVVANLVKTARAL
ncbi:LysR family transcriptional regulator [Spirillospora sp. CA-294931]|uniref:LysR family transcriptional regulator n=1 Tax=Spirillospora sp. CA-294931 TaxID=3240042 RepID=UPI003D8FC43C